MNKNKYRKIRKSNIILKKKSIYFSIFHKVFAYLRSPANTYSNVISCLDIFQQPTACTFEKECYTRNINKYFFHSSKLYTTVCILKNLPSFISSPTALTSIVLQTALHMKYLLTYLYTCIYLLCIKLLFIQKYFAYIFADMFRFDFHSRIHLKLRKSYWFTTLTETCLKICSKWNNINIWLYLLLSTFL